MSTSSNAIPFIGKCKDCKTVFSRVAYQGEKFYILLDENGEKIKPIRCCGSNVHMTEISGVVAEHIKCDSRCHNGKGAHCSCSCGGLNHGRAYSVKCT